jgi:hypothetical protein
MKHTCCVPVAIGPAAKAVDLRDGRGDVDEAAWESMAVVCSYNGLRKPKAGGGGVVNGAAVSRCGNGMEGCRWKRRADRAEAVACY